MYRRHVGDVYRYALAVMRNPADAEDVTQTTFLNAYRSYTEKGNRPEKPQNWLIAIAHNVCRQRFRQASRRVQEVGLEDDVADHLVRPEDDDVPTSADLRRALGHLAFNQRAALVMRELEGKSYTEMADLLGLVMVGPHVTDLIEAGVVAIDAEATVETVADGMTAHPTLSEGIKEAGLVALGRAIHLPNRRRAAVKA